MLTIINDIQQRLMVNIDPDYFQTLKKIVPTDQHIIGVRIPHIRAAVKEYHKEKEFTYTELLSLVDTLFKNDIREEILFGLFLLEKYKNSFDEMFVRYVDNWIDTLQNWEICDQLAKLFGMYFAKHLDLYDHVLSWESSENFWRRRFVLASSVHLNQKGASNVELVLQLIRPLMFDEHPMVTKALSWSIRECCKHDKTLVFHFLFEFKGKAAKKIIWDASKKLEEHFRRELI